MKRCRCGATYTREEWGSLPLLGHQGDLELRNCSQCRSTLAKTSPASLRAGVRAKRSVPSAALSRPEAGPKRAPPSAHGPAGDGGGG